MELYVVMEMFYICANMLATGHMCTYSIAVASVTNKLIFKFSLILILILIYN